MQEFLGWLARLRGIPIEEGAELQFEFSGFPSGGAGLLTILGMLAALAIVIMVYRRDGRNLTRGQRIMLGTLRGLAILTAFLVVLEPNLVSVKKDVRDGHSIILLDVSQSMGHRDAFRRPEVQGLAGSWGQLGQSDLPNTTRMELAKALLSHDDYAVIKKLSENNKVLLYTFGAGLETMPQVATELPKDDKGNPIPLEEGKRIAPQPKFDDIIANGKYSNLGGAIRSALQKSRHSSIASVIVLTDGRRNIGAKGAEISRYLTQRKVDHTLIVGIGDPSETQTVAVARIEAPERAFQKDPFKIRATVTSQGYDSLNLAARLIDIREGETSGTVVESTTVTIAPGKQEVELEFVNIKVAQPGVHTYRVEIDPPVGEPTDKERHGKESRVEILDQKTRVLLIAGGPMHEYQILRQLLTRDNTVELSCWLLSADRNFLHDGNVNLKELPTSREELEPFDVFIFMDPDPAAMDLEFCQGVAKQVEDNGAGMWWVIGEKYSMDAFDTGQTTEPLVDLLPVVIDLDTAKILIPMGRGFSRTYPYELTPQGRNHQIARLVDSGKDENDFYWSQLPGWHFTMPVKRAKPAASVLIATTTNTRMRGIEGPMPIFATQFVGAGRVLFSGTDETYRWRSLFEDQYNRFWVKGIRYLFEGRLTAGSSRLRIDISGEKLELGEPVKISVTAKDETYRVLVTESFTLRIARGNEPPTTLELSPAPNLPGQYEVTFRPTKTGFYRITPNDDKNKTEATFQVVAAAVEREGPVDNEELGAIAGAKGGQLLSEPAKLLTAIDAVKSRTTIEKFKTPHAMWDSWITIALILTLLALEWWLRKMWNLL
jgi:hypothetical protein